VMGKIVAEKASKLTYSQICHEMVLGKMGSDVYNEAKKVCPAATRGREEIKITLNASSCNGKGARSNAG